jgi:hypothetical protein
MGGAERSRARGQHQAVIALLEGFACVEVFYRHAVLIPMDAQNLMAYPNIQSIPGLEGLRGLNQHLGPVFNYVSYVIRHAAIGEGDIIPLFKDHHL